MMVQYLDVTSSHVSTTCNHDPTLRPQKETTQTRYGQVTSHGVTVTHCVPSLFLAPTVCPSTYLHQLTLTACSTQKIQEDGSFPREEKAEHTHKSEWGTGQRWKLVVGTITEESKDYFATCYWAPTKVTITSLLVTVPQKSNDYFATCYWAL